ncbi:type VI secretion system Vgr family protein [Beijerinckia mobilis]|uniref:type VI secretion system Vgr family protein n=1 Tax=Beijerinckia mobilis TaxID=231434 RepID=UPI00068BC41A|nr:type VI secretion system tip protein TssI/VgrG [Beijerinckia mobilis]
MANDLKQVGRSAVLSTPLGRDELVLSGFDAVEGLSELFEFRIDALSERRTIDFDQILGRSCSVSMKFYEHSERYFSGVAVEAQAVGNYGDLYAYRLVLRPAFWFLTRTTNCRIFHNKKAIDIVTEILGQRNVDYQKAITRNYPELDYCVQYRETDFAFISRLLEQHGIYYSFKHEAGRHTLVLADSASSHQPVPGLAEARYTSAVAGGYIREQAFFTWSSERRFRSGTFELRDYDFRQPNKDLTRQAKGVEGYDKATTFEFYDYPGKYDTPEDGKLYVDARLGAEQAVDHRRYASGETVNLVPGGLVTVKDHPAQSENKQYLVVRCTHHFSEEHYRSTAAIETGRPYHGAYELHPADRPYRAPMVTPRPIIHGLQTAKVVARGKNADQEEIDTDNDGYGLIKVRFHWDRDDKRSCWMRVAQTWAGLGWGGQFIPRIGMEVVVAFLEGDPDKPLVVGAVYNGQNKFPYVLPDNKTQSGIKSDSSKGHGGYNELMFEDKKGSEKIKMHGQKDHEVVILNAETVEIGKEYSAGGASRATTLKNGDDILKLEAGSRSVVVRGGKHTKSVEQKILIESLGDTITLQTGASSIKLSPSKIEISSMMIALSATKIDLN